MYVVQFQPGYWWRGEGVNGLNPQSCSVRPHRWWIKGGGGGGGGALDWGVRLKYTESLIVDHSG